MRPARELRCRPHVGTGRTRSARRGGTPISNDVVRRTGRGALAALQCLLLVGLASGLAPLHTGAEGASPHVEQVADAGTSAPDHDHRLCELYWSSQHEDGPPPPRAPRPSPSVRVLPAAADDAPPPTPASPSHLPRAPPRLLSIHV